MAILPVKAPRHERIRGANNPGTCRLGTAVGPATLSTTSCETHPLSTQCCWKSLSLFNSRTDSAPPPPFFRASSKVVEICMTKEHIRTCLLTMKLDHQTCESVGLRCSPLSVCSVHFDRQRSRPATPTVVLILERRHAGTSLRNGPKSLRQKSAQMSLSYFALSFLLDPACDEA